MRTSTHMVRIRQVQKSCVQLRVHECGLILLEHVKIFTFGQGQAGFSLLQ